MRKFLVAGALGLAVQAQASTAPANAPFTVTTQILKSISSQQVLQLQIADAQDKSGVCPYLSKSFQYLEAIKTLDVEIYQEPCFNEMFGKSKGDVFWALPRGVQAPGTKICLLINQKKAAALVYDSAAQTYKTEPFASCGDSTFQLGGI